MLGLVLKVVLGVAAVLASPFLAAAFLFWLLDKPFLWWIAIPLMAAALPLLVAIGAWLFVRSKLKAMRAHLDRAARIERSVRGDDVVIDVDDERR